MYTHLSSLNFFITLYLYELAPIEVQDALHLFQDMHWAM